MEIIIINPVCPFCGRHNYLSVPKAGYLKWQAGANVQDAFPNLTAAQREMLLTGMCEQCQDKTFGKED